MIFKHSMGRSCREWAPGAANAEFECLLESLIDQHHNTLVLATDGSVTREPPRNGWGRTFALIVTLDPRPAAVDWFSRACEPSSRP